jgi:small GTP-binding protein
MKPKNFRNDLKIIVIGNAGTGKTSFVNKWTKNTFNETYKATIVSEFGYKIYEYKGKVYKIQIWDLAGKFYLNIL